MININTNLYYVKKIVNTIVELNLHMYHPNRLP